MSPEVLRERRPIGEVRSNSRPSRNALKHSSAPSSELRESSHRIRVVAQFLLVQPQTHPHIVHPGSCASSPRSITFASVTRPAEATASALPHLL